MSTLVFLGSYLRYCHGSVLAQHLFSTLQPPVLLTQFAIRNMKDAQKSRERLPMPAHEGFKREETGVNVEELSKQRREWGKTGARSQRQQAWKLVKHKGVNRKRRATRSDTKSQYEFRKPNQITAR